MLSTMRVGSPIDHLRERRVWEQLDAYAIVPAIVAFAALIFLALKQGGYTATSWYPAGLFLLLLFGAVVFTAASVGCAAAPSIPALIAARVVQGVGAAALLGFVAVRWSRQHDPDAAETVAPSDPDMDERLDDELRNLD